MRETQNILNEKCIYKEDILHWVGGKQSTWSHLQRIEIQYIYTLYIDVYENYGEQGTYLSQ